MGTSKRGFVILVDEIDEDGLPQISSSGSVSTMEALLAAVAILRPMLSQFEELEDLGRTSVIDLIRNLPGPLAHEALAINRAANLCEECQEAGECPSAQGDPGPSEVH